MNGDSLATVGGQPPAPQQQSVGQSLADAFNVIAPALVGASGATVGGSRGRAMGAEIGLGAGAEAVQAQQDRARKIQAQQAEMDYQKSLRGQAQQNADRLRMANEDAKQRIANRDELLKGVTDPKERQKILDDPQKWITEQTQKAHRPDAISTLVTHSRGVFTPELFAGFTDEELHAAELKMVEGGLKQQELKPQVLDIDGKRYPILVGSDGKVTQLKGTGKPVVRRDLNPKTGEYEDVGIDATSGEELWRKNAGAVKPSGSSLHVSGSDINRWNTEYDNLVTLHQIDKSAVSREQFLNQRIDSLRDASERLKSQTTNAPKSVEAKPDAALLGAVARMKQSLPEDQWAKAIDDAKSLSDEQKKQAHALLGG